MGAGARRIIVPYADTLLRPYDYSQNRYGDDGLIGPQCDICRKVVDKEEQVDESRGRKGNWIEVRVFCHGAESTVKRFDYESKEWDEHDVRRSMNSHRWFEPDAVGEVTHFQVKG